MIELGSKSKVKPLDRDGNSKVSWALIFQILLILVISISLVLLIVFL